MNYNGSKISANHIYLSKFPAWRQKEVLNRLNDKEQPLKFADRKNIYTSFTDRIEASEGVKKESLRESNDAVNNVITWLEKTYNIISDRSDILNNTEERQRFKELALIVKEAIPNENIEPQDVERYLILLKQKIEIGDEDSEHLKKLKNHIKIELTKFI